MVFLTLFYRTFFNVLFFILNSYEHSRLIQLINQINPVEWFRKMFLQTLLYPVIPILQVFCQLSSLTISYPNPGLNISSLILLVPMYVSYRPPSPHCVVQILILTISHKMNYSVNVSSVFGFLTIIIPADSWFLSNITRGDFSGTTTGSLLKKLII